VARLAGIPRRLGYERHGRGILLTDVLHHPLDAQGRRLPAPIVEAYLKLARHLGCTVDSVRLELATTAADEAAADRACADLGLDDGDRIVCLNTGGAFGPAKNWPTGHFADLARRLAEPSGAHVLVLCGPRERENAREIVAAARHDRVVSLADQELGIGLTKACVRRSALLITTDSGPRHFAAAFGTPVITLFGPTFIAWTRTHHPMAWHVSHPVPCGPCQRPICPEGHHRCMRDLAPESVYRIARRVLGTNAS
jgi:heptosyltransferase-2